MYPLYELACTLSLRPPGCRRLRTGAESPRILRAASTEIGDRSLLVLVINNGNLLFRYQCKDRARPVYRQLPWLKSPMHQVSALSFDPSGSWLLCAESDASLCIVPLLSLMDATAKINQLWSINDVTRIQMSGKRGDPARTRLSPSASVMGSERAQPTSIVWWQTQDNQQIAVVGNELGEICFINLITRKEVGGTYITVAIISLDLIRDDTQDTVYLLVTGSNSFQWQLLLEQPGFGYRWPFEQDDEVSSSGLKKEGLLKVGRIGTTPRSADDTLYSWTIRELFGPVSVNSELGKGDQKFDHRPQRLAKFAGHTHLMPQNARGRQFVAGYYSPTNILSVHSSDLSLVPLFVYKLPPCEKLLVTDQLLFVTTATGNKLVVLATQFLESNIDGKKETNPEAEVQVFPLPSDEVVMSIIKRSGRHFAYPSLNTTNPVPRSAPSSPRYTVRMRRPSGSMGPPLGPPGLRRPSGSNAFGFRSSGSLEDWKLPAVTSLDGCIIVTETAVYECRPRIAPENLFLQLVLRQQDLRASERLGIMLGLDVNRLYEAAADFKLGQGQFAAAVRLYQLSKCPHVRSVANFAAHGCISELLSYVRVLFSGQAIEFTLSDKRHFANMELLCYVHEVLEVRASASGALTRAFRVFLLDNHYYSEQLCVRLLAEQGLYELLLVLASKKGLLSNMAEELLRPELSPWLDLAMANSLSTKGFGALLKSADNDAFVKCIAMPSLIHHLLPRSALTASHSEIVYRNFPQFSVDVLLRLAHLYDPSRPCSRPFLRRILSVRRYSKSETLNFMQNESEFYHAQLLVGTFLCILIVLNAKKMRSCFDMTLMQLNNHSVPKIPDSPSKRPRLPRRSVPIGCGAAHAALVRNGDVYTWGRSEQCCLGHGLPTQECFPPTPVESFSLLKVKVVAVACGSSHTLALTNSGVYAWGSSRYGQLGTGCVDKEPYPAMVEALAEERIVSVACGQYHSLALTADGRVFTWGWGVHGQLGHGNPDDYLFPRHVKALANEVIVKVTAGYGHTAVLSAKGEVYTFGCALFGQLGLGTLSKQNLPQLVLLPEKINLLACGYFHCMAVSSSNKLYTWGSNPQLLRLQAQASRKARLQTQHSRSGTPTGNQDGNKGSDNERRLVTSSNEQCISVIKENAESDSDEKRNAMPLLALQSHLVPSLVESTIMAPITQVVCGSHHSAVLSMDGEVYTWGRNLDGQLGNGSRKEQKFPTVVEGLVGYRVTHLACGSDFTVAADSEGRIWGWGHNDCGQVGPDVDTVSMPGKTITIKTNKRVVQLRNTSQWGVVKPQEITGLAAPHSTFEYETTHSFDADGMSDDDSIATRRHLLLENLPPSKTWEAEPYGIKSLHFVLEVFFGHYDISRVLAFAVEWRDFQAASKICILDKQYTESFAYQLQALKGLTSESSFVSLVAATIEHHIGLINEEDTQSAKTILLHTIRFWIDTSISTVHLEELLLKCLPRFLYPLCLLLFCYDQFSSVGSEELVPYILSCLSTKFCLQLISAAIVQIKAGSPYSEFLSLVTGTSSVTSNANWQPVQQFIDQSWSSLYYLKGNGNDSESIVLTPRELESLVHALEQEGNQSNDCCVEVVLFSCGHHYTCHSFQYNVLPKFEEAMRTLPYSAARTTQALMASYRTEGLLPMACPRCVLTGIKESL